MQATRAAATAVAALLRSDDERCSVCKDSLRSVAVCCGCVERCVTLLISLN